MMKTDSNLLDTSKKADLNVLNFFRRLPSVLGVAGIKQPLGLFGTNGTGTVPVASTPCGTGTGDPHFVGMLGQKYDVMGEPNKCYNIVSCKNFQFNVYFMEMPLEGGEENTWMMKCGIKVGDERVGVKKVFFSSKYVKFNGTEIPDSKKLFYKKFPSGIINQDGTDVEAYVIYKSGFAAHHRVLEVCSGAISIKVWWQHWYYPNFVFPTITLSLDIKPIGLLADGVMPHGLLGQTANEKHSKNFSGVGESKQGEGVIDGHYSDYEVSDLFADDFKYNRFGVERMQKCVFNYVPKGKSSCMAF